MTQPVANLIETFTSNPGWTVKEAGTRMLEVLSEGRLTPASFREDPPALITGHGVSRYLAQVTWRALEDDYPSLEEVVDGLRAVLDRDPPALESGAPDTETASDGVHFPEARVLRVGPLIRTAPTAPTVRTPSEPPESNDSKAWGASFEAYVTSGRYRDTEVRVDALSSVNPSACFAIPYFWLHASVAAYNLREAAPGRFEAGPRTFFVLEPLRQVNATSVANGLHCPKPQIDRLRRGRGDVTVHTIRGLLVHDILDRLIEGDEDPADCYESVLGPYKVQLAAIVDSDFNEEAFRAEVLRHAAGLQALIEADPHMREDPQVELRRYSATLGIQGRIDAVFRTGNVLDIVELKTGRRIRPQDHLQLFTYRLLFSDYLRRERSLGREPIELRCRILSSHDGTSVPLRSHADFQAILETRNRLLSHERALCRARGHVQMPYADYDAESCGRCPSWTRSQCRTDTDLFGDRPDAPETPELEYFRRLSRRVRQEGWAAGQDLADLLDDSRLGARVSAFRTIPEAVCEGSEDGTFLFRFESNTSDLTVGDRVLLHSGRISSQPSFHGYIRSIGPEHARIGIPLNNLPPDTFQGRSWIIDRFTLDLSTDASQTALHDFLCAPMDGRKRAVLGEIVLEKSGSGKEASDPDALDAVEPGALNPSQRAAVRQALGCATFHLIWGPPGTGKTQVIPEIASRVGGSVLLGAFTNTALDKILVALVRRHPDTRFVRIGRSESSPELTTVLERLGREPSECFSEDLASASGSVRELRRRLDRTPIMAATAHRSATHPYLRGRAFEMALVDEAGQLTEPLTLGLIMRARRFVLIGDDRQLPPVVRTRGLETSLFERLKAAALDRAPGAVTLLDTQYRMHPEIMDVANRLYYDGRLSAGIPAEERVPPSGGPVAFVPSEFGAAEGRSNAGEAGLVEALVRSFLEFMSPEEIGVISPFRAQAVLLRRLLEPTGVTADTVERFQGGERDVIIMSFVRSQGSGFVFDDRRLNVAFTRARRKLVLVGHPDLFRSTRYEWLSRFLEEHPLDAKPA